MYLMVSGVRVEWRDLSREGLMVVINFWNRGRCCYGIITIIEHQYFIKIVSMIWYTLFWFLVKMKMASIICIYHSLFLLLPSSIPRYHCRGHIIVCKLIVWVNVCLDAFPQQVLAILRFFRAGADSECVACYELVLELSEIWILLLAH